MHHASPNPDVATAEPTGQDRPPVTSAVFERAIERLHERLLLAYGDEYLRKWQGIDAHRIYDYWSDQLSALASHAGLYRIAWALENLPERCPSVPAFKRLCYEAPIESPRPLPAPTVAPEKVRAELARLGWYVPKGQRIDVSEQRPTADHRGWARRILTCSLAGDRVTPISLRFAREALRLPVDGSQDRVAAAEWGAK